MKYCLAYLRVSTEDQTVENQRIALQEYAAKNDMSILHFFEDPAVSGSVPAVERNGFREMLEVLRGGGIDAILVYELSRVGRTFWDTLAAIKVVEKYAPLVSCSPKEVFLQTMDPSVRKLLVGILTWVAEREREVLIERIKAGMKRAKLEGRKAGRRPKQVDMGLMVDLLESGMKKDDVAASLQISKPTLYKKMRVLV